MIGYIVEIASRHVYHVACVTYTIFLHNDSHLPYDGGLCLLIAFEQISLTRCTLYWQFFIICRCNQHLTYVSWLIPHKVT